MAAGPRFLHLQPGLLHVGGGEQVTVQGAFGRQLVQPFTDLIIDHLVQLRPGLGPVAVADRLQARSAPAWLPESDKSNAARVTLITDQAADLGKLGWS